MAKVRFYDYLQEYEELRTRVIQIENDVRKLRGGLSDWEENIEADTRASIKILYAELKRLRVERTAVLSQDIDVQIPVERFKDK